MSGMILRGSTLWQASRQRCVQVVPRSGRRWSSTAASCPAKDRTRNIGIIAHIDAGKTTTTERMLYYSGLTRRIGDVDEGSTVTDFLPAERARGITIQSAAVTFHWPPEPVSTDSLSGIRHTVNLIDTPGHADFTFEVLRSLRILDGAICVLDGVAGVEAQTEKVWAQANRYNIPRIVFVNKLDREGAAFGRTVKEIASRLRGWPAVCHIPWFEGPDHTFTGIGDAISLCALKWSGGDGKKVEHYSLETLATVNEPLSNELKRARTALVEALCEFDEVLLTKWLECDDDSLAIPAQDIWDSLRRCVLSGDGRLIPVFAGASFRNMGVQPLLDAVNNLLPDPNERPDPEISIEKQHGHLSELLENKMVLHQPHTKHLTKKQSQSTAMVAHLEACALAFKVVNDSRRGVLVYVRVYSGAIHRNAPIWNTNLHVSERAQRLLQMQAADAVEISSISAGQIGVIAGLKHARTGDTLISYLGTNPKVGPPAPLNTLQLRPIEVPPPVFFAAVEPHSLSEEKNVADTLALLLREDPSLHVNVDEESGQMLLSGMGELHLEIARDRLVNDFRAKATMGSIEIGYRECLLAEIPTQRGLFDREVAGKKGKAGCEATLASIAEHNDPTAHTVSMDGNTILVRTDIDSTDSSHLPAELSPDVVQTSLVNGAIAALARGPRRAFAIHSAQVELKFSSHSDSFGPETTPAALASAARLAVQTALRTALSNGQVGFMEPVMNVVISCDEASLGAIVHDISSARGGQVLSLGDDNQDANDVAIDLKKVYYPPDPFESSDLNRGSGPGQQRQITARVPLKEMVGYLKHLRSITGGRGTFIMSFDRFERVVGVREKTLAAGL